VDPSGRGRVLPSRPMLTLQAVTDFKLAVDQLMPGDPGRTYTLGDRPGADSVHIERIHAVAMQLKAPGPARPR
jgi:hypothetical protein